MTLRDQWSAMMAELPAEIEPAVRIQMRALFYLGAAAAIECTGAEEGAPETSILARLFALAKEVQETADGCKALIRSPAANSGGPTDAP